MAKLENVIIIGAGPAGISAALYLARGNMNPLLIYDGTGALEKAEKIENYYGLSAPLSGSELFETGLSQVKALGVRTVEAQVLGLGGFDTFEIKTTEGTFESRSVILATGGKRKAPQIPGLKEFEGRGVSYCAVCDAFFYRGKDVAVLGNSDFALHEAEELSNTAGSDTMKIQAIEGDGKVSGLRLGEELKATDIESGAFKGAEGVFVALGTAGSGELARQIGAELTEKRNIQVNSSMETTVPGLFAAGDCTGGLLQIAKAVYEGAQAGISAGKYVRSLK